MTTFKDAQETTVFVLNYKLEIEKTTYADHVLVSLDECTHPIGIMPTLDVKEIQSDGYVNKSDSYKILKEEDFDELSDEEQEGYFFSEEAITTYAVVSYRSNVRGFQVVQEFDTEEEANNDWFARIEKYDFARDDQRNTSFFYSEEEAINDRAEYYACDNNVSVDVAKSILRKMDILRKKGRI